MGVDCNTRWDVSFKVCRFGVAQRGGGDNHQEFDLLCHSHLDVAKCISRVAITSGKPCGLNFRSLFVMESRRTCAVTRGSSGLRGPIE